MNGKHRARWLADIISEIQRFTKQAGKRDCPEVNLINDARIKLDEARSLALNDPLPDFKTGSE